MIQQILNLHSVGWGSVREKYLIPIVAYIEELSLPVIGHTKKNDKIIQVERSSVSKETKRVVKMSTILGENKWFLKVYTGIELCVPSKVPDEGYWFWKQSRSWKRYSPSVYNNSTWYFVIREADPSHPHEAIDYESHARFTAGSRNRAAVHKLWGAAPWYVYSQRYMIKLYWLHALIHRSAGTMTGYELDGRDSIPDRAKRFSLLHNIQTDSGAQPDPYPMLIGDSFPGNKATEAWNWLLTSIYCRG